MNRLLLKKRYDFILAIGDDTTDEDMFCVLSKKTITIKVGDVSEVANFNLPLQSDVLPFLRNITVPYVTDKKENAKERLKAALGFIKGLLGNKIKQMI